MQGVGEIELTNGFASGRRVAMDHQKRKDLKSSGTLHPAPSRVKDPLFEGEGFFDREDLVQVKYEMLRRVSHESRPVSEAARSFGFSRPSFYKAKEQLEREGLAGLVPRKPGPHGGHKLNAELMAFIQGELERDSSLDGVALAALVRKRFKVRVHRRTVERALARKKKR